MSKKMYTRLLRLYPSRFRKQYEEEAQQLIHDRLRDETGFFNRIRLWLDLATDLITGLPQAYRNSYVEKQVASLSPNIEGVPSFKVLDTEPLRSGTILVGGTMTLCAIVIFGFVLSHPLAYGPLSGSSKKPSAIESVLENVNKATLPDTSASTTQQPAKPASQAASVNTPQPLPPPPFLPNSSNAPGSSGVAAGPQQAIPIRTQSSNKPLAYPAATAPSAGFLVSATPPQPPAQINALAQEPGTGCIAPQLQYKARTGTHSEPTVSGTSVTGACLQRHDAAVRHARRRMRRSPQR